MNNPIQALATYTKFMGIMRDYMERQNDDLNFDERTEIYDLYDDLVHIYDQALNPQNSDSYDEA